MFLLFLACGKYSPAVSPDTLKPASLTVESVQTDKLNGTLMLTVRKPLRLLNQSEYSKPDLVSCVFQGKAEELIELTGTAHEQTDTLVVYCPVPREFVGSLRIRPVVNGRVGVPSQPVRVYNREVFEAFIGKN